MALKQIAAILLISFSYWSVIWMIIVDSNHFISFVSNGSRVVTTTECRQCQGKPCYSSVLTGTFLGKDDQLRECEIVYARHVCSAKSVIEQLSGIPNQTRFPAYVSFGDHCSLHGISSFGGFFLFVATPVTLAVGLIYYHFVILLAKCQKAELLNKVLCV